ncbi:Leucine Rich Repeat family protein [Trichomonas vaginalis G3]|uniref:Leucine Rich Repeat family protein n=1 Tax=Trichomonas vaginalis (strain ATCC PRA-98 / G3) TaxID=412133 RepID=A2FTS2_TRIV3|nr:uncharacterized protein TVAGG3_0165310 [Trichomonas vaginalis G3]EAX91711.1 Leucine Rich Repeat family protein [Trichomonas vaginalis G3]KAI5548174.1 barbed-end actin filament uncapping [Trichomonas vaginalis G3]|eukprot:XP_001304641.1 hypothetical protein [Trichomonas vaginalis G3]
MSGRNQEFLPSSIYYPELDKRGDSLNIPDGELSKKDRDYIVGRFRKDQQPYISYARPATLRYNMGDEFNGIIACSPHFVGIFIKKDPTSEPKKSVIFHIFDISSLRIRRKHKILLFCRLPELDKDHPIVNCRVICSTALMFAQILRRNYLISTCAFDPTRLCDFATSLPDEFPTFYHHLSPSQQYQHTYYAFCSRLTVDYNHEIAEFYHDRIKYEDGVFDFGLLPPELTEEQIIPAILALYYVPYVHGLIVHKRNMPYIARRLAPLISKSKGMRFIHLVQCGIDSGVGEIGNELKKNPRIPLSYYNFSYNNLSGGDGLEPLFQAFKVIRHSVFYLSIGRCNVNNLRTLFEAIANNEVFLDLKYLYFNGNYSPEADCEIFCQHLENLNNKGIHIIKSLGIDGDTKGIVRILQTLEKFPQPIEELSFEGTRMQHDSSEALLHYVKQATTLRILDLSYTLMDPRLISMIVYELSKYERIRDISIKLNGNELNREKLMIVATGFLYSDLNVWTSVSLADNNLTTIELDFLISFLWRMPNLEELDISDNFSRSMADIGPVISKINKDYFKKLKKLRLRGSPRNGGPAHLLYTVLDNLTAYDDLEVLDLSNNNLGELGFQKLSKVIQCNKNLKTLYIDGNAPVSLELENYVLKEIYATESIDFCVFPIYDAMQAARHSQNQEEYFKNRTIVKKMRQQCSREINKHRYAHGLPSKVSFEAVKELGDLVDEIKTSMQKLLKNVEKAVHCGVCKDMGVTLPYLAEKEPIENGGRKEIHEIGNNIKYQTENLKIRIYEEGESHIDDFYLSDPDFLNPEKKKKKPKQDKSDEFNSDSGSGLNLDQIPGDDVNAAMPPQGHHHKPKDEKKPKHKSEKKSSHTHPPESNQEDNPPKPTTPQDDKPPKPSKPSDPGKDDAPKSSSKPSKPSNPQDNDEDSDMPRRKPTKKRARDRKGRVSTSSSSSTSEDLV